MRKKNKNIHAYFMAKYEGKSSGFPSSLRMERMDNDSLLENFMKINKRVPSERELAFYSDVVNGEGIDRDAGIELVDELNDDSGNVFFAKFKGAKNIISNIFKMRMGKVMKYQNTYMFIVCAIMIVIIVLKL